jgi:hypothetical protein
MAAAWGLFSPSELLVHLLDVQDLADLKALELDPGDRAIVEAAIYRTIRRNGEMMEEIKKEVKRVIDILQAAKRA